LNGCRVAVIKEFSCIEHGEFESSHPICPNFGCNSKFVERVFLTAPGIGTAGRKRFDAGIRQSAEMMRISNFRSARGGETSYGGDKGKELGMELLWGKETEKKMGRSFAQLTQTAQQPFEVAKRDGSGSLRLDRNNAMREAATEMGITRRRLPRAHEVGAADKQDRAKAEALTA
jgi:hypothetical protein